MLLTGSTIMFITMISVGVIVARFRHDWANHKDAGKETSCRVADKRYPVWPQANPLQLTGWAAIVLIWIYVSLIFSQSIRLYIRDHNFQY